uniref:PsbP C-terminal domain-containing protein n=1 Tax=Ditylum brightwellii TaxID=49249 RepID=A0A6S8ZX58_9STRA|mmetsp:Transcript_7202/g.10853  ORF Transcript_7202/g.10853 Transcript_7202/m.10853 type:complete len:225 (+) Transcript_7202:168-842(+)
MARLSLAILALMLSNVAAFAPSTPRATSTTELSAMSRREAMVQTASIAMGGILASSLPAFAEVTEETPRIVSRMGGLLERYQDGARGLSLLVPSGWNKFEGEVGAYDVKWQDLVDPRENVKISSSPVKSTTSSIDVLGEVQEVGLKLAAKRDAKLIKAEERITDGILFYKFDFAINDGTHQLLQLCVNKGKVWSLDANTTEKRWSKREEMYNNILGSFLPKLAA